MYVYIHTYSHKYYSHANTRKQPLCVKKNQISTRNKLQDIVQCNRYIHLVKSDAESDEHIRAELHVLKTVPKNTYAKTGLI